MACIKQAGTCEEDKEMTEASRLTIEDCIKYAATGFEVTIRHGEVIITSEEQSDECGHASVSES